jgi:hypothetical protein
LIAEDADFDSLFAGPGFDANLGAAQRHRDCQDTQRFHDILPFESFLFVACWPQDLRRVGMINDVGMQLKEPQNVLVTWAAPESALGGNAELGKIFFGRVDAAAGAFDAVSIVNKSEIHLADPLAIELRQRLEKVVVAALARNRHLHVVYAPGKLRRNRIADGDARRQVARL